MPVAAHREDRPRRSRRSRALGALRRSATPLVALCAVLAVVLGAAPHRAPATQVDVVLASFQDPAPPSRVDLTVLDGRLSASWPASSESSVRGYSVTATAGSTTRDFGEQQSGYTLDGLANGTAWTVSVRTVTYDSGFLGIGAQGPFTGTEARTATATPAALSPTGLAITSADRQLTLSWSAPADPTVNGYQVWSGGRQIATTSASTRSYTQTGLVNGQTYSAAVRATYSSGHVSADSASASGVPRDSVAPAAPTGLVATRGDGRVALSWAANSEYDLSGYRVLRGGTAVATTAAGTRSFTDTGLTNDTAYSYALQALDTSGNASTASSPAVTATPTDLTPPSVPTGLTATRGDGSVALAWTANPEGDLASYRVLRDGTAVATVTAPTTTWSDTGLTNGRTYQYALQAVDTHGNASAASSPAASATPADTTPPAVPTGLAAVRGDTQVSLTWTANTEADLDGYDLFRDGVRVQGAVLGAGATSFTDTGLTNDTRYTYTLRARDHAGNSSPSSAGVSATPTDLTPPAVPSPPSAVAGDGVVSLSWTPSSESDLASYQVLRDGVVIATVTRPTTTYDDRSVTNGTAYGYALAAVDTHGNASAASSPAVSATPRDLTPPAVPTGVSAARGDGRVVLSWTAGSESDLASYRVLRDGVEVAAVTVPATTYTDTGLTNDTAYQYSVAAYDAAGNGSAASSPQVSATPTDLTPPAAPSGVASTAGDGAVEVTWQANTEPDLASYRVYRDGQLVTTITVVAAPGTTPSSYRDTGLANGAPHTYAVTAVDTHGNESTTSTTGATPVDTTAPGAASGLTAAPADQQVALTWTASPDGDVATYRVLRDGVEVATVAAPATSHTDTGLANGRAYSYAVVAVDAAGNRSAPSGATTTTPRDAVAPAAPTAVSATPGSGSATVRWTAPADTDLAGYRVLRADGTTAGSVSAPATSLVVSGLTNGTTYTFRVVVTDTSGNTSTASASVSVTPAAASVPASGAGQSGALAVSRDGRWVVVATAAKLETTDTNRASDLYRIDTTGAEPPRRLAVTGSGGATSDLQASDVAVSADGRYMALATKDKLTPTDTNGLPDVYRADLSTTPTTWTLVSATTSGATTTASSGVAGTALSTGPTTYSTAPSVALSADGTRIAFYSKAPLVTSDTDTAMDLYVKDLTTPDPAKGPITRASTAANATSLGRTAVGPALALTPDGRYVLFTATGPDGPVTAIRKDLTTTSGTAASASGPAQLASTSPPATRSYSVGVDTDTGDLAISDDGRYVAFSTVNKITTSAPGDNWSTPLAYRKDLTTGDVLAIGSGQTNRWEHQVTLSPDGRHAAYLTTARAVPTDGNGKTDAYRRDLTAPTTDPLVPLTSDASGAFVTTPTSATARDEYGRVVLLASGTAVLITVQPMNSADTNGVRDLYAKDPSTGAVTSLVGPLLP
ncbi:fibronectin type III domain-containing protein [Streptomyces sp. NP160]|uniref:fibronectin type III domain-containing protein n=1 Tax=Streptomyces sp. NP160 TaxID=2586637 RepID=UPI0015D5D220|nr:fibronectin type III domain-containing protein [Streptomyces sp. NP160]